MLNKYKKEIVLCIVILIISASVVLYFVHDMKSSSEKMVNDIFSDHVVSSLNASKLYLEKEFGEIRLEKDKLVDNQGQDIAGRYTAIDKIQNELSVVATVFIKNNSDFVRVITSIKKADGDRAVGTNLGTNSAAYPTVMKGERYIGEAKILGKQYLTGYTPLKNAQNEMIGLLFVGIPKEKVGAIILDNTQSFQNKMFGFLFLGIISIIIGFIVFVRKNILPAEEFNFHLQEIYKQISQGDFSKKFDLALFKGRWHKAAEGINYFIESVHIPLMEVSSVLNKVAQNNLKSKCDGEYCGEFFLLKESLNKSILSLSDILTSMTQSIDQVNNHSKELAVTSQGIAQG